MVPYMLNQMGGQNCIITGGQFSIVTTSLSLAKQENFDDGLTALNTALRLDPQDAESLRNIAKLKWHTGDQESACKHLCYAIDICPTWQVAIEELVKMTSILGNPQLGFSYVEKALEYTPNNIDLLYLSAIIAKESQEYDFAIQRLEKILELQPKHGKSYNEIGLIYSTRGHTDIAIEQFKKGMEVDPYNPSLYYNHGIVLLESRDYESSLYYFNEAVSISPTHIDAQYGLIRTYERLNKLDLATNALEKAKDIIGPHSKLHAAAARIELRKGNKENAYSFLQKVDWDVLDDVSRRETLFLAGEIYSRINDVDNAMNYYIQANQAQRAIPRAQQYDKKDFLKEFERACKVYTTNFVKNWSKPTKERLANDPVFFVGFPRSGTTLLETVLDSHPNLTILEEQPTVATLIDPIRKHKYGYPEALKHLNKKNIEELREYYYNVRDKYITPAANSIIIDKLPLNTGHVGALCRIFPGAKIIFSLRHPADSVLSCLMQNFSPNPAMNNFYSLEEGTYCYDIIMSLWKLYKQLLSFYHVIVPYEAMVDDLEGTVRPVLDFLGVGWHEEVSKYRDRAQETGRINTPSYTQVTQPIYTRARYRWQKYRHHMEHVLDTLLPWAEWQGYVHHEDGSITHPTVSVHQPEPAEYEEDEVSTEPVSSILGLMLENETEEESMLVERIRKVSLKNNMVRIECITYGPDGEEQVSGTMHIPANVAGEVVQSLTGAIQQLSQSQKQELREAV